MLLLGSHQFMLPISHKSSVSLCDRESMCSCGQLRCSHICGGLPATMWEVLPAPADDHKLISLVSSQYNDCWCSIHTCIDEILFISAPKSSNQINNRGRTTKCMVPSSHMFLYAGSLLYNTDCLMKSLKESRTPAL